MTEWRFGREWVDRALAALPAETRGRLLEWFPEVEVRDVLATVLNSTSEQTAINASLRFASRLGRFPELALQLRRYMHDLAAREAPPT